MHFTRFLLPAVLCAASVNAQSPDQGLMRVALLGWPDYTAKRYSGPTPAALDKHLQFLQNLNYTHVMTFIVSPNPYDRLDGPCYWTKAPVPGSLNNWMWQYTGHSFPGRCDGAAVTIAGCAPTDSQCYTSGPIAEAYVDILVKAAKHGLQVIPVVNPYSHGNDGWVGGLTWLDPSTSEFDSLHPPPHLDQSCSNAKDPQACREGLVRYMTNPKDPQERVRQVFKEYLRMTTAAATKANVDVPKYFCLGYDELGHNEWSYVGEGVSNVPGQQDKRQLVVDSITNRIRDIDEVFGSSTTRIILFADSFVPTDNGEVYKLIGDSSDGNNGVLDLLAKQLPHSTQRVIASPWAYSGTLDGESKQSQAAPFSREEQLRFVSKQGFQFIFGSGGDAGDATYKDATDRGSSCKPDPQGNVNPTCDSMTRLMQGAHQWYRASLKFPASFLGYGDYIFGLTEGVDAWGPPDPSSSGTLFIGWSAAALRYMEAAPLILAQPYRLDTFKGLDILATQTAGSLVFRPRAPRWRVSGLAPSW